VMGKDLLYVKALQICKCFLKYSIVCCLIDYERFYEDGC
jgi:hypothetical protein